jgi:hypothetical protein
MGRETRTPPLRAMCVAGATNASSVLLLTSPGRLGGRDESFNARRKIFDSSGADDQPLESVPPHSAPIGSSMFSFCAGRESRRGAAHAAGAGRRSAGYRGHAPREPALWLAADSCPSAQLLREMLEPLVESPARAAASLAQPQRDALRPCALRGASVWRASNVIEVAGVTRAATRIPGPRLPGSAHASPRCSSRSTSRTPRPPCARADQTRAVAHARAPPPHRRPAPAPANTPAVQVGLGAFASVGYALPRSVVAPGGGLELWMRRGIWRLGLSAAAMGQIELAITPQRAGWTRGPDCACRRAFGRPMWRVSRFELGPALALAVDLLRAQRRGAGRRTRDLWRD